MTPNQDIFITAKYEVQNINSQLKLDALIPPPSPPGPLETDPLFRALSITDRAPHVWFSVQHDILQYMLKYSNWMRIYYAKDHQACRHQAGLICSVNNSHCNAHCAVVQPTVWTE